MLPLAFLAIAGGILLLVAGTTGSSLASVVAGHPDGANAKTPSGASAGGGGTSPEGVTGGSNAGSPHGPGGSVEKQIVQFFMSKGLSRAAAAGIAGNAAAESGYDPNAPGGGLFQTIGGRGVPQGSSVHAQLESAWSEIQARGEVGALRSAQTPEQAARIFQESFEKPASRTGSLGHREQAAREAFG